MAFGITVSGGGDGEDFLPLLTYNAKGGRMKTRDRVEGPNGWEAREEDLTGKQPSFVMDLANVMVGWLFFKAGMQPVKAVVPNGQPIPDCPTGDFGKTDQGKPAKPKQGFVLRVLDNQRVLREFSSNAAGVVNAMGELHTQYETAPEAAQGLLPVVQHIGDEELRNKHGSNFAPKFVIVKWIPRPAEFGPAFTKGAPINPRPAAAPAKQMADAPF